MRRLGWVVSAVLAQGGDVHQPLGAVVEASWARPLPSARGTCALTVGGTHHDAMWLVDGPRWHLAVLDTLRRPALVVRSDGLGLSWTEGGVHRVAAEAEVALAASEAPSLLTLPMLAAGRLPPRPVHDLARAADDGVVVAQGTPHSPQWLSVLHPDGRLRVATLRDRDGDAWLDVVRTGEAVLPERMSVDVLDTRVVLACAWGPLGEVPPQTFHLLPPPGHRVERLETTGWRLLARLAEVARSPVR